jgi:mannobiose 2-epimerase
LLSHFFSSDRTYTHALLTEDLQPIPAAVPLGHDIKTSWLLDAGADAVCDANLSAEVRAAASTLARAAVGYGQMVDGSFVLERTLDGELHPWRYWWVQAEGLVGLLNEAERSAVPDFLERAERLWAYIEKQIKDPTGEWYSRVDPSGVPDRSAPKVDPWKDPYHQGRACLRLIERAWLSAPSTRLESL